MSMVYGDKGEGVSYGGIGGVGGVGRVASSRIGRMGRWHQVLSRTSHTDALIEQVEI